jgi:serine protease AprX
VLERHGRGYREMGIEATGAEVRKGPGNRFGIRWDDGGRSKRAVLALALGLALLAVPASAAHADVVVVAKPHRLAAAERVTERVGGSVTRRLPIVHGFAADVPRRALPRLARSGAVRAVSRDGALKLLSTDPGAGTAAASAEVVRSAIGADGSAYDGAGVGVAVLDSGAVAVGGLERPGTLVRGPDFSSERNDPDLAGLDTFGHGTHVAGIIAGSDGVAPGAHVISVKVAGADGVTSLGQVLTGLDWIRSHRREHDIRIVNLSLGTDESDDYRHDILAWAAEQLWNAGIAVVASAGNKGAAVNGLDLPAADPFVIAVGATDTAGTADPSDDTVADFSSRSTVRPPDMVAPGTGIVSLRVPGSTLDTEFPGARIGDGFFRGSGTSQAAAVVSGVAAQLLEERPRLSNDQLKALLVAGAAAVPGARSATGAGRVDLGRSASLRTPPPGRVKQRFASAVLDLSGLGDEVTSGDYWDGRRWSGMKWSGRRWSGMKWAGMKWSGAEWADAAG